MKRLGLAYHELFTIDDTGPGHPDRGKRIETIMDTIRAETWFNEVEIVQAREATPEEIALVHNPSYVEAMRRLCDIGGEFLPALQAAVGKNSYLAALQAVGAGLTLGDGVMEGRWKLAFAPTRPPGHHAVYERPKGFCIFNNIAILARYLIKRHGLKRIGIFDFDVHHGNGTTDIFWDDPNVLYCSIHCEGLFPSEREGWQDIGGGAGEGFNINIPLPAGSGDDVYLISIDRYAAPRFTEYAPEIILVSAGFDGHERDFIGGMKLTRRGFEGIAERMKWFTNAGADGRIISLLEGGYDIKGVAEGISGYLGKMMEE